VLPQEAKEFIMAVITISRQYGSGGDQIAARICDKLAYQYFDKRLMAQVATEVGLSEDEVVDLSEDNYRIQSFFDRLLGRRSSPERPTQGYSLDSDMADTQAKEVARMDEADRISLVRSTVRAAYERGNVVIVGRGGQAILKDKADVLHVRIESPYRARVQRLHQRANYSLGGAKDAAIKHDRASAEYLGRFYEIDWADPALYDLVISTAKLETGAAASVIVSAVEHLTAPITSNAVENQSYP
jgi:cytidylate kinase